jgi:hypothetical protein
MLKIIRITIGCTLNNFTYSYDNIIGDHGNNSNFQNYFFEKYIII